MTLAEAAIAGILKNFGGDPQRANGLAAFLGFEPVPNPEDVLAGGSAVALSSFSPALTTGLESTSSIASARAARILTN